MWHYFSMTMNKETIYSIWAPDESPWSQWAKPVLFAHLDSALSHLPITEMAGDVNWAPPPGENVALVLDLPGPEGVLTGVALAERGYRPIPLYNAIPLPSGESILNPFTGRDIAAVNVIPILGALRKGAEQLANLSLPLKAPPVFLLDANRSGDGRKMQADEFDNRSISFTTDFPSGNFLLSHGIQRVILVQRDRVDPQSDLAHTLRRWQDAGINLQRKRMELSEPPETFEIARPSWYGTMFQRALAAVGFRRARGGGFGAWMPESSAGG
jgi:hypothetical protein